MFLNQEVGNLIQISLWISIDSTSENLLTMVTPERDLQPLLDMSNNNTDSNNEGIYGDHRIVHFLFFFPSLRLSFLNSGGCCRITLTNSWKARSTFILSLALVSK